MGKLKPQYRLSRWTLATIGVKHFGNPIPQEWYAAARELLEEVQAGEARNEGDCVECGGDCPRFCCQVFISGFGSKPFTGEPGT